MTDARRFEPPVGMGEALAPARLYRGRANVECVATDAEALAKACTLVDRTASAASGWPRPSSRRSSSATACGRS